MPACRLVSRLLALSFWLSAVLLAWTQAGYGLLLAVLWPFLQRDTRTARRFLATHPTPRA